MASNSKYTGRTAWIIYSVGIFLIIIITGLAVPPVGYSLTSWLGFSVGGTNGEMPEAALTSIAEKTDTSSNAGAGGLTEGNQNQAGTSEDSNGDTSDNPGAAGLPEGTQNQEGTPVAGNTDSSGSSEGTGLPGGAENQEGTLVPAQTQTYNFAGAAGLPEVIIDQEGTQVYVLPLITSGKPAEIVKLAAEAGWPILTPEWLPADYTLQNAYFDAANRMAVVTYTAASTMPDSDETTTKTITLIQAQSNDFVPMQMPPEANATDIEVQGQPAVLVTGAWESQLIDDPNDPEKDLIVSVWRDDLPILSIYWQEGHTYLVLMADDDDVSKEDLNYRGQQHELMKPAIGQILAKV